MRDGGIDRAKGIGILLVVWGHIVARDLHPAGNGWYGVLNEWIYSFHMAFFFYLSGLVFFRAGTDPAVPGGYAAFLRDKAVRLLQPWGWMAVIVYAAKASAARFAAVDRAPVSLADELPRLLLYPTESYVSSLWFLVALFAVFATVPLLWRLAGGSLPVVTGMAMLMHFLPMTKVLALHQVARYLLFFVLAAWVVRAGPRAIASMRQHAATWVMLLVASLVATPARDLHIVAALLALTALHGLAERLHGRIGGLVEAIGRHSFAIYLFNTLAIGGTKALLLKTFGWDGWRFIVVAPLLLAAGVALPMALRRIVLRRWTYTERLTR